MRSYRIYGTSNGSSNSLASIQLVKGGRLKSIRWVGTLNSIVDNTEVYAEISEQAAAQSATNNSQGVISTYRNIANFATSGLNAGGLCKQDLVDCPVSLGQLLYLNVNVTGTGSVILDVFVDIQES